MVVPVNKAVRVSPPAATYPPVRGALIRHPERRCTRPHQPDLVQAAREGVDYGECSELCGKDHAYMPIAVKVVSEQAFAAWLEEAKKKYARGCGGAADQCRGD